MTTLREAAELALDALEYHTHQTRPIHNTELAIEALRSALAAPKPPAKPATLIDVTIDDEGALSLLRDMVVQENGDLTPVRLLLGDGHSGHGLYITSADYPEEGAWLIAPVPPTQRTPENCGSGHCRCIECLKTPELSDRESMLISEMRYIAGISTGQIKRVADAALANCADGASTPEPGDREALIKRHKCVAIIGANKEMQDLARETADMLEADRIAETSRTMVAADAVKLGYVPDKWRTAVAMAYGHLWHINVEPMAPIPMRSDGEASTAARLLLKGLLTMDERCKAINSIRQELEQAAPKGKP